MWLLEAAKKKKSYWLSRPSHAELPIYMCVCVCIYISDISNILNLPIGLIINKLVHFNKSKNIAIWQLAWAKHGCNIAIACATCIECAMYVNVHAPCTINTCTCNQTTNYKQLEVCSHVWLHMPCACMCKLNVLSTDSYAQNTNLVVIYNQA